MVLTWPFVGATHPVTLQYERKRTSVVRGSSVERSGVLSVQVPAWERRTARVRYDGNDKGGRKLKVNEARPKADLP